MPQIEYIEIARGDYPPTRDNPNIFVITKEHDDDDPGEEQLDYVAEYDKSLLDTLVDCWLSKNRIKFSSNSLTVTRTIVDEDTRQSSSPELSEDHEFNGFNVITIYTLTKIEFRKKGKK